MYYLIMKFNQIAFTTFHPGDKCFISYILIYNANLTVANAVKFINEGSKDSVMEAVEYLQEAILNAFKNSKEVPWPPTADDLDYSPLLPPKLTSSLEYMILGSNTTDCSEHVKCIILSVGQDICRGVSTGKWKLPEHILLASTIHHLYCGKKLVTIINRLGHCKSYNCISELDSVMATALEGVSSLVNISNC